MRYDKISLASLVENRLVIIQDDLETLTWDRRATRVDTSMFLCPKMSGHRNPHLEDHLVKDCRD